MHLRGDHVGDEQEQLERRINLLQHVSLQDQSLTVSADEHCAATSAHLQHEQARSADRERGSKLHDVSTVERALDVADRERQHIELIQQVLSAAFASGAVHRDEHAARDEERSALVFAPKQLR